MPNPTTAAEWAVFLEDWATLPSGVSPQEMAEMVCAYARQQVEEVKKDLTCEDHGYRFSYCVHCVQEMRLRLEVEVKQQVEAFRERVEEQVGIHVHLSQQGCSCCEQWRAALRDAAAIRALEP